MTGYHKYVFDIKNKRFVGKFEEMYKNEPKEGYDSWGQDGCDRDLLKKVSLTLTQDYNFGVIVDMGCGKGNFTRLLKKRNNRVVGIDISKTALKLARQRYSDVDFIHLDINRTQDLDSFFAKVGGVVDLVVASEVLSYVEKWKTVFDIIAKHTRYILVTLFIPDNPIGFVKSEEELVREIEKRFELIEWITFRNRNAAIILGRRKRCRDSR